MRIVRVKFNGSGRTYEYKTDLPLIVGATYTITADSRTTYDNPITVMNYGKVQNYEGELRIITDAVCRTAPATPDDGIKRVFFNEEKGTTVVLWKDGVVTKVAAQNGESFDKEKGIALCYMKRMHSNRGAFNKTLKKWC